MKIMPLDYDNPVTPFAPVKVATIETARRTLAVLNKGLTDGVGNPVPGEMCVEAAVCYAMGQKHGDKPSCVAPVLRNFKIDVNDLSSWNTHRSRANGLRRLAVIQLGSKGHLTPQVFNKAVCTYFVRTSLPRLIQVELSRQGRTPDHRRDLKLLLTLCRSRKKSLKDIGKALRGSSDQINSVTYIGNTLRRAPDAAGLLFDILDLIGGEQTLIDLCEDVVQVLKRLKVPGARFLKLTKLPLTASRASLC